MGKKLLCIRLLLMGVLFLSYTSCVLAVELESIKLSEPQLAKGKLLMQALKERRSTRSFSQERLPLDVLSNLLWAACGANRPDGKRTAPSAFNAQEIDLYVALEEGLYLYDVKAHVLEPIMAKDIREVTGIQDFTQKAPVNLVYVADFSKIKAGKENNFYTAVDTGYISQNVYLFCASEGLVTVVLGMVDRPGLKKVMNLRPQQKVMLVQPVGYPK